MLATLACASVGPPPAPDVADRARSAASYSGSLRVSLKGPGLRARTRALVAFERPQKLRTPSAARLKSGLGLPWTGRLSVRRHKKQNKLQ